MKVLSIGNSFSQDAQRWLHQVATAAGVELTCVNLDIGGCSLRRHWENVQSGEALYDYEVNACSERKVSLLEGLRAEKWDVITLQQVSGESGRPQSYLPHLPQLAALVRQECPDAKLYMHETWSYEIDSGHPSMQSYNNDQDEMDRRIHDAYVMAGRLIDAPLIPSGEVIRRLRATVPAFDYRGGTGESLHRDGYHLSLVYGRYAAAITWFATLCGVDVTENDFIPAEGGVTADSAVLAAIRAAVMQVVKQ